MITCPLTTGLNNFNGDALDNTFDATITDSLTINDALDGGAGTDKLTAYVTGTTLATGVSITNIETIDIVTTGAGFTIDASVDGKFANLKTLSVNAGAGAVDIKTKANATSATVVGGTTVGVTDNGTTDTLTTVSVTKNTGAATITSDVLTNLTVADTAQNATVTAAAATRTLNLTVNKLTGGTILDAEATTLNLTSTGTASTGITVSAAKAAAIAISGDKSVSFALAGTGASQAAKLVITNTNTVGATITTELDADVAYTGAGGADAVTAGLTTVAINMGAGADTVTLSGAALGADGTVIGGNDRDTLIMSAANAITASASTSVANFSGKATGFEILEVNARDGAGAEIKLGALNNAGWNAIDTVTFNGALATGAITVSGLASGGTVNLKAANTSGVTVGIKDAVDSLTDVLNLNLTNESTTRGFGTVTAASVETINIKTIDTGTGAGTVATTDTLVLVTTLASTVKVSGNNGLNITNTGNVAITNFDASGIVADAAEDTATLLAVTFASANTTTTASVTITGGAGNDALTGNASKDTIVGGIGDDSITGGLGADVLTGGLGLDTYVFADNASEALYTLTTGRASAITEMDKVTDFGLAAADKLDLAVTAVVTANSAGVDGVDSAGTLTAGTNDFIKSHAIVSGIITFDDQDAYGTAVVLTDIGDIATALDYLVAQDLGAAGTTVAFVANSNTYVFQQLTANKGATDGYALIELTGVTTATSLIDTGTTASAIFIA